MWNNEQNLVMKNQQMIDIEFEDSFLLQNHKDDKEKNLQKYHEGFPLFYNRNEIDLSTHRPVSAYYIVTVKEEDAFKKDQIFKDLVNKKINQIAQEVEGNTQQQEYWQNDEEDKNTDINHSHKQNIFNQIETKQIQEGMEEENQDEEEDDEDEDIQGQYDIQQQNKFFIDQTVLNNTTKPKYKYSEDNSNLIPEQQVLNLSNNDGELKNNKMRFKQAVNSATKNKNEDEKQRNSQNELVLSKCASEKSKPEEQQSQPYISDFQRNKLLNQPNSQTQSTIQGATQSLPSLGQNYNSIFLNYRKSNDAFYQNNILQKSNKLFQNRISSDVFNQYKSEKINKNQEQECNKNQNSDQKNIINNESSPSSLIQNENNLDINQEKDNNIQFKRNESKNNQTSQQEQDAYESNGTQNNQIQQEQNLMEIK